MAKTEISYSNVLEQWAGQWPEVTRWLGKLQVKQQNAYWLYQFCQWANLNPKELLALKEDQASKTAEKLLDTFVSETIEDMTNPTKVAVVTAVKSFYKHNYCDLARASGVIDLVKQKPYHKPTKGELRTLSDWCFNPRDSSIISLAASTAIAKETISNLKWGHLEDDWENQEIPHISIPPKLIKGHGRGRYKGVRQETFLTPEAKQDLLRYKAWIEQRMERKVTKDDHIYLETREPYEPLSYSRLGGLIWKLSKNSGIPFSLHDCRRYVQTALEEARIPPNWARKIRGRKVRGEENPYSRPEIEKLREAFRDAVPLLEFRIPTKPVISKEDLIAVLPDESLAYMAEKTGISIDQVRTIMMRKYRSRQGEKASKLEPLHIHKIERKRKVINEDQLENELNHGWRFISVLPSSKILIEKE